MMIERIFAIIIFVAILPVFLFIIILNIIFSGFPIFFIHPRCGYRFHQFKLYKFRTMYHNDGPELTNFNDFRITKFGKILRKYKLDELPQIINIIKGDMRFIGPRPEVERFVKKYPFYFTYLKSIKPGISDLSSIVFKEESKILNKDAISYENDLLPIKNNLSLITINEKSKIKKITLVILSGFAILNHKLSLKIISKFFLPYDEIEIRNKLNYLLLGDIF